MDIILINWSTVTILIILHLCLCNVQYSTEDKVTEVTEKARSTAEEFIRQAKEKKDEIGEAAKETLDNSKEAVLGETHQEKERFKEKVEKGDYERIGRT